MNEQVRLQWQHEKEDTIFRAHDVATLPIRAANGNAVEVWVALDDESGRQYAFCRLYHNGLREAQITDPKTGKVYLSGRPIRVRQFVEKNIDHVIRIAQEMVRESNGR